MTSSGYLLLADITGYTSFLASTPTEVGGNENGDKRDRLNTFSQIDVLQTSP
jgi:hypothetical protein